MILGDLYLLVKAEKAAISPQFNGAECLHAGETFHLNFLRFSLERTTVWDGNEEESLDAKLMS